MKIISRRLHSQYRRRIWLQRFTIILLALAVLNLSVGCMHYFKVNASMPPTGENLSGLTAVKKTIIVHFDNKKWVLVNPEVKNNQLSGKLEEYRNLPTLKPVKADRPNRYMTRTSWNQSYLLNEVHIYPAEFTDTGNGTVSMPISSLDKLEIYEKDIAATVGSWVLGFLGGAATAFTVFIVLLAIFKESCPFVYTWDGTDYRFAGEIYSGSIYKNLERHDYLRLPTYPGQESYRLKITNEAFEIQHTNLAELIVADHASDCDAVIDKYGRVLTLGDLQQPVIATNLINQDVTQQIREKDNLIYQTSSATGENNLTDGLILQFPPAGNAATAKLAIRAKNSVMLDFMLGRFHDMFGSAYRYIMKMQGEQPREVLQQWMLDQGIPLSVSVKRNNAWEFTDFYNIAGPMAMKDDVLEIPLNGTENTPLEVKIEFGSFFWEIDYAAIDYSPRSVVSTFTIPLSSAVNEHGRDISRSLKGDDSKYYTQPTTADQAVVTFNLPAAAGPERTIYLHSKGWYELMRNPKGPHDKEYLLTFKQPGRFNQFVIDEIRKIEQTAAEIK